MGAGQRLATCPRTKGDVRSEASLFDVIEGPSRWVKYLSAYAFSTKNCNRSPDEVGWLRGFAERLTRCRMLRLVC